ncbi:MAG: hypothetical protein ACRDHY_07855, partial [Anaerolineales bacterium]
MSRMFSLKLVVVGVTSLFVAGALATLQPAYGAASTSDRAFAEKFRRPGAALDPVLSALSAGRLARGVAALAPGQIEVPAVPLGFAFRGAQLPGLDVTRSLVGKQELDVFLARLQGRGFAARAA